MTDIFISYSRADRDQIGKLAAALEAEGFDLWWDQNLAGGTEFSKETESKLNDAKVVLVAWSKTSMASHWVADEATVGRDKGVLLPIAIEDVQPKIGFRQFQTVAFDKWNGQRTAPEFEQLAQALRMRISGEVGPIPAPSTPTAAAKFDFTDPKIWGGSLALLAMVVALGIFSLRTNDGSAPSVETVDAGVIDQTSIAVLAFDDFSPENDQEYFADGISEELLNVLARLDGLRVASRTSAFAFKGRDASVGEIAKALNVGHVLEGSVRKAGTTLRITAQLIDARTDQHIWSETYDRPLTAENIFAIQDEISKAIAAELQGRMDLPTTLTALQTNSTEAYDAYLRGRSLVAQRTSETINEGLAELNRAATLDPDFALAQAALVEAYILANTYAGLSNEQTIARATPHADRAIALAPDAAESLAAYGWLLEEAGDFHSAIDYFEHAIAANPNDAEIWRRLGLTFRTLDRFNEAKKAFKHAYQLDPLSPIVLANWSIALANQGELAASGNIAREAVRLWPNDVVVRAGVADALWYEADFSKAHRIWKNDEAISSRARRNLAYTYDEIGLPELAAPRANAEIEAVIALRKGDKAKAAHEARSFQPILLLWAGDVDQAYEFVKADIEKRDLLSDKVTLSPPTQYAAAYYLDILSAHNDPDADVFKRRLATQFKDRTPADFEAPDSIYAAAKWRMINNDPEGALVWLEELIDRGQVWRDIDFDPMFDALRDTPKFQALMVKREESAARHRALIKTQLTDPDPNWITP